MNAFVNEPHECLLQSSFGDADRSCTGWTLAPLEDVSKREPLAVAPEGQVVVRPGAVRCSPAFAVTPLHYYQLSFGAKASAKGMWGAIFFNDSGERLLADHYGSLDASGELASHRFFFRAKANAHTAHIRLQPLGSEGDPRGQPEWTAHPDPQGDDYRVRLCRMARQENVEYLDMETIWKTYIGQSGRPYEDFLRDPVHANALGRQVLARILTAWFAPKD